MLEDTSVNAFSWNSEERPEIIEGLLGEGELAAFAGPFGMGKTPVIVDLTIRLINGIPWCGRRLAQRPIVMFDLETPGAEYRRAVTDISARLGVSVPRVPEDLDLYLERDRVGSARTALLAALSQGGHQPKLKLVAEALRRKPNAVVFMDPLEMLFRLDTCKKSEVLALYRPLRNLLDEFPHASVFSTFNLRKKDRKNGRANLLQDPRDWLEEVCGSLDLLNRCDVRLGMDFHSDDVRVINGIVRSREMHPILIRPVKNNGGQLAGFEQVVADRVGLLTVLTSSQKEHWDRLPPQFRFDDVADRLVPRSSLHRLIARTLSLGVLERADVGFRKVQHGAETSS